MAPYDVASKICLALQRGAHRGSHLYPLHLAVYRRLLRQGEAVLVDIVKTWVECAYALSS